MFQRFSDRIVMGPNDPPGSGGGGGGGGVGMPPVDVMTRFWAQANGDIKVFQRLIEEWQAQQNALRAIADALPPNISSNGVQIDEFHWADPSTGTVWELRRAADGSPTFAQLSDADSKRFLGAVGSSGGSGGGTRLASDDPRYWDLQYRQLDQEERLTLMQIEAQLINAGMDRDAARQQALTTLITNRNNTAVDHARISADIAKQSADYAANPRDAFAELFYRNQVEGVTPFGDMTNEHFGEYGEALADKGERIFGDVRSSLDKLGEYRDAIPLQEFLGSAATPAVAQSPQVDPLTAMTERLRAMAPDQQEDFREFVTGGQYKRPVAAAKGATFNFDRLYDNRAKPGFSPPSSEGGMNINIHERAVIVGESGQVYGTLGERRPDGSQRGEQLIIKPLKSEVEKDKKLAEANKAQVESQKQTLAAFAGGGSVSATPDDLMEQLSQLLGRLGGAGGGVGSYDSPLPSLRLLAGAPAQALRDDRRLGQFARAGYSALGIDDLTFEDTIRKFTPEGAQGNRPRVAY